MGWPSGQCRVGGGHSLRKTACPPQRPGCSMVVWSSEGISPHLRVPHSRLHSRKDEAQARVRTQQSPPDSHGGRHRESHLEDKWESPRPPFFLLWIFLQGLRPPPAPPTELKGPILKLTWDFPGGKIHAGAQEGALLLFSLDPHRTHSVLFAGVPQA